MCLGAAVSIRLDLSCMQILLIMISIVAEETTLHKVQWVLNSFALLV